MPFTEHENNKDNFVNIIECIPKNRWMLLPFIKKAKPPPSSIHLVSMSETIGLSDDSLAELLHRFGIVKLRRTKGTQKIDRILYFTDRTSWNALFQGRNIEIDYGPYAKYNFICFCTLNGTKIQRSHPVKAVMEGTVKYRPIYHRVKMRLASQIAHLLVPIQARPIEATSHVREQSSQVQDVLEES